VISDANEIQPDESEAFEAATDAPQEELSSTFASLARALDVGRNRLLDRSLRNKLISTNIASTRARQVRVMRRGADETFQLLRGGRPASFVATVARARQGDEEDETDAKESGEAEAQAGYRENQLPAQMTPDGLQKRLTSLYYEGQTIEEEQGVSVLYLALGFLEWREAKQSEIARFAPLVLQPVELVRDGARDRFKLRARQDDLYTNVSLQAWLKELFGIELPELPEGDDWKPSDYFHEVEAAIGTRPGWAVRPNEIVLGFFSFSKFLMWRDLDPENWPDPALLSMHPLLGRILLRDDGDDTKDDPLVGDDERVDEVFKPSELIHITDADSSQAIAIQEVMAGKNLVIQGPPGTGKSQTITNIIAGAVARGKRVLFVSEKMAALEVVHQRLVDKKLGAICLELHSRKASKGQVIDQIKQARSAPSRPAWPSGAMKELEDTQVGLRAHSDRMHGDGEGHGYTPFELIGRISLVKTRGAAAPIFSLPSAAAWPRERIETEERRARQLGERVAAAGPPRNHPWRGIGIEAPDRLEQERLRPVADGVLSAVQLMGVAAAKARAVLAPASDDSLRNLAVWAEALDTLASRPSAADALLCSDALIPHLDGLTTLADGGERLLAIRATLQGKVRPDAWSVDWMTIRRTIAGRGRSIFRMFSGRYRDAVAELRGAWVDDLPKSHDVRVKALDDLLDGVRLAGLIKEAGGPATDALGTFWRGEKTDWTLLRAALCWISDSRRFEPAIQLRLPERMIAPADAQACASGLRIALDAFGAALDGLVTTLRLDEALAFDSRARDGMPLAELEAVARRWSEHFGAIVEWPPIRDDLKWLRNLGCGPLANQVFNRAINAEQIGDVLLLAIYEAKWAQVRALQPEVPRTEGDELAKTVGRFRKADLDRISLAADEVGRAHADGRPSGKAGAAGIVDDETRKVRNLKPVRKLMEQAGDAVQAFKPVFLMSPLSVAQYLPPGQVRFDLLVIDEASQVRPEDAIGAIARCDQVVVVGDDKQLPPTNFFNRMINDETADDEDDEIPAADGPRRAAMKDIESILSLCSRFPERMLRWHYRSEHPGLIAISNRNFYRGELMLPPSVIAGVTDGSTGLIFHKVAEGGYDRGRTRQNEVEAEEVAEAALRHARECPDLSLGIGTFSVAQRDAIRDRLDRLCALHPELDEFVKGRAGKEPVFVKNLENIQGDERDVIFISVGYGKDRDGRLYQSFGPVGAQGGERRLNVLITRARKRCEVFSSIVAEDIRIDGAPKPGVVALKEFLKLAKDGFVDTAFDTERSFDSDFEESVAYEIKALGYHYRPQVGMAGFFIDIGVVDPANEDRYILGVECDGAAYHSSRYARDRDRLRQMILERRGWKLHRIWSTDWFYRKDREVAKLKDAIEAARVGRSLPTAANIYDFEPQKELPLGGPSGIVGLAPQTPPYTDLIDEAPSAPARPDPLRPYELTEYEYRTSEPHNLSDGMLAELVERIVEVEQPIHEEEVARRLAHVCGLQRAGSRVQDAALRGLRYARRQGRLGADQRFWSEDPKAPVDPRSRADLAAADPLRKPEMISGPELAAAAVVALRQNLALTRGELVTETARLIGWDRVGGYVQQAIESAIDLLGDRVEHDHLERLRLRSGSEVSGGAA
jgi:very-short-patch-repair endonuclease